LRFCVDAVKLEEAAAEKRYFDSLIHDGMLIVPGTTLDVCRMLIICVVG